jgi:SEC-C motif-containing protein
MSPLLAFESEMTIVTEGNDLPEAVARPVYSPPYGGSMTGLLGIGADDDCPCGSGASYGACCGPLHRGAIATTAEALMRSRYSAYALGETDHLWRTWHPRTRPDRVTAHDAWAWRGLEVHATTGGGRDSPDDTEGTVTFTARYDGPDGPEVLRERSRFVRRGGRWVYLDGTTPD